VAINLGTAYVDIVPSTQGLGAKLTRDIVAPIEQAGDASSRGFGSRFVSGVTKVAKIGMVTAGAAAGGLFAGAMVKGLGRLTAIDDARGKLRGLGHDAESIAAIMDSALESVKGTAFGLGDAATISASAVAAGIKPGQELTEYLKLTADAATIAGVSLTEMGQILNKTTTAGRVYTMELNQLADRGLPIFQWLQDEYQVTAEELRSMVASGKVDAATFRRVIEENIGGAALESGNTFRGAMANIGAALGRAGASVLQPFFSTAKLIAPTIIELIDSIAGEIAPSMKSAEGPLLRFAIWFRTLPDKVGPAIERVTGFLRRVRDVASSVVESVRSFLGGKTVRDGVSKRFGRLVEVLTSLGDTLKVAAPAVAGIAASLAAATARVGIGVWDLLVEALNSVAIIADTVLVPALELLNGFMADHPGLVTAIVAAYTAWKVVTIAATVAQGALNAVMALNPITLVVLAIAALVAGLIVAYHKVGWFRDAVDTVWKFLKEKVWPIVTAVASAVGGFLADAFAVVANDIETKVIPVLSTLWDWFSTYILPVIKDVADFYFTVWSAAFDVAVKAVGWLIDKTVEMWDNLEGFREVAGKVVTVVGTSLVDSFDLFREGLAIVIDVVEDLWGWFGDLIDRGKELVDTIKSIPGVDLAGRAVDVATSTLPFLGRAAGGPVTRGTPYVVGEVGPELFVPGQTGTIIPNHQLTANEPGRRRRLPTTAPASLTVIAQGASAQDVDAAVMWGLRT
jgi:tape measure domain-containing protein